MDPRGLPRDGDGSVRRMHPAPSGRGIHACVVEIVCPTPDLLAHDPATIAGFESLGRRVLLQAFADAAQDDGEARAFLTTPDATGLLAHWVRQAGLRLSLSAFARGAATCLNNPQRMQALFGRSHPPVLPPSRPLTPEDSTDE